jgi:hypothetical protein
VKNKEELGQKRILEKCYAAICNAGSILQNIARKCMKYGDNVSQNAECTWMPRNY